MHDTAKFGIIGGTGVYDLPVITPEQETLIRTERGVVNAQLGHYSGGDGELSVVFVARHGTGHSVPPHRINYHANILALQQLGVTQVLGTTAVGSLRESVRPGELVLLDQFLDFTSGRNYTFFDGGPDGVRHTDMTHPYDESMRQMLIEVADACDLYLRPRGTYVCTEGPRFETAAEIDMFARLGGDVVGMTNVPEVVLARELGLQYAAVSLVTNYGAGLSDSPLTHEEVQEAMEENQSQIAELTSGLIKRLAEDNGEESDI